MQESCWRHNRVIGESMDTQRVLAGLLLGMNPAPWIRPVSHLEKRARSWVQVNENALSPSFLFSMGWLDEQESPQTRRLIAAAITAAPFLHNVCREFSRNDSEDGFAANDPGQMCSQNSPGSAQHP